MIVNIFIPAVPQSRISPITGDHHRKCNRPFRYINGGPVAMPDKDFARIINEAYRDADLPGGQYPHRDHVSQHAVETNELTVDFATDTPTGTGMMPLGMIKTVVEMACLTDHSPEMMVCAATGNNANISG